MCRGVLLLLLTFFSCFSPAVLLSEEQWYLISEMELQSIDQFKKTSELEKQSWLSQVQRLSTRLQSLQRESESLNSQLQVAREMNRALNESFNKYEQEQLALLSSKNGELKAVSSELASQMIQTEKLKGQRNVLAISLGSLVLLAGVFVFLKIKAKLPI